MEQTHWARDSKLERDSAPMVFPLQVDGSCDSHHHQERIFSISVIISTRYSTSVGARNLCGRNHSVS